MKLQGFTLIALGVILMLFATLSFSLIRYSELLDDAATSIGLGGQSIRFAEELRSLLLTHNRDAFLYAVAEQQGRLTSRRVQRNEILERLQTIKELSNSAEENTIVEALENEMAAYLAMRDQLSGSSMTPLEQYNQISDSVDSTAAVINRLIAVNREQLDGLTASVERQKLTADGTAITLLACGLCILLALMLAISALLTKPLAVLAQTMRHYGNGDDQARFKRGGLREIREIGGTFNVLADRLEEKRRERMRITAAIAHDIRTPLNSLSLAAGILVNKKDGEDLKLARVISRQVMELDRQVSDLLDTSRLSAGQFDLKLAEHDINQLLRDTVELYRSTSSRHDFILEIPTVALRCVYDSGRMMQVMNNLLSNAVKYSPAGGKITISARKYETHMEISVADEGPGISPEDRERIFEDFYRAEATKESTAGIGLGLSISRRIVEAHNGTLNVESTLGNGSVFYIRLPVGNKHGNPTILDPSA